MAKLTRAMLKIMHAELADMLRFQKLPEDLRSDTPKVLSGLWYRSETIRDNAWKFGTPTFDALAYQYTLAREERGEAPPDRI